MRASPLFMLEIAHVNGTGELFVGCFPREFEFPQLDSGRALQDIRDRSGVVIDPPTPLFDLDGNLAGYNVPGRGFLTLDVALELDSVQRLQAQHVPSATDYGRGVVVPSDPSAKPDNTGEDEERQQYAQ